MPLTMSSLVLYGKCLYLLIQKSDYLLVTIQLTHTDSAIVLPFVPQKRSSAAGGHCSEVLCPQFDYTGARLC